MFKKVLLTAAAAAAVAAVPAGAVTVIAQAGAYGAPATGGVFTTFDFNSGNAGVEAANLNANGFGFETTGSFVGLQIGSSAGNFKSPAPGDNSYYVSVQGDSALAIKSLASNQNEYNAISLYLGSVDDFNSITILDKSGNPIGQPFSGSALLAPNPADGSTSYRITFTRDAGDAAFGGILIASGGNAGEFDNLVFAVPEPSTWALMLAGFGMVGMAMRARRRRTSVVFG